MYIYIYIYTYIYIYYTGPLGFLLALLGSINHASLNKAQARDSLASDMPKSPCPDPRPWASGMAFGGDDHVVRSTKGNHLKS